MDVDAILTELARLPHDGHTVQRCLHFRGFVRVLQAGHVVQSIDEIDLAEPYRLMLTPRGRARLEVLQPGMGSGRSRHA